MTELTDALETSLCIVKPVSQAVLNCSCRLCYSYLVPHQPYGKPHQAHIKPDHHCFWKTTINILSVLTDCAHSGQADMDPAMADAEEDFRSRAVSLFCAMIVWLESVVAAITIMEQHLFHGASTPDAVEHVQTHRSISFVIAH